MRKFFISFAATLFIAGPVLASSPFGTVGQVSSGAGATFNSFSVSGGGSFGTGNSNGMDQSYATFNGTNGATTNNTNFGTYQNNSAQTGSQFNESSKGNAVAISNGFGSVVGTSSENVFGSFGNFGNFKHTNNDQSNH